MSDYPQKGRKIYPSEAGDAISREVHMRLERPFDGFREWVTELVRAAMMQGRECGLDHYREWNDVTDSDPPDNISVLVAGMKNLSLALAQRRNGEWLIETGTEWVNIYPPRVWKPVPVSDEQDAVWADKKPTRSA
jgi:hypothetical protein